MVGYNLYYVTDDSIAIKYRGQDMKMFSRFLAVATVIALGLAFSPEASANHMPNHDNVAPGQTVGVPHGCFTSPATPRPKKCLLVR